MRRKCPDDDPRALCLSAMASDASRPYAYFEMTLMSVCPPSRGTSNSAGWDLFLPDDVLVAPGSSRVINTRARTFMPPDCYGRLELRSHVTFPSDVNAALCEHLTANGGHSLMLQGGVIGEDLLCSKPFVAFTPLLFA